MGFWGSRDDNRNEEKPDRRRSLTDEQAIERYRYMLQTAPPETIQQAHEEAFARLTPDQRGMVLQELTKSAPPEEGRRATDDPASLAKLATRTEMRQPGMLERILGPSRMGGGMGMGGMLAGSLLASIAGTFIASSIAHSFFDQHPFQGDTDGGAAESSDSGSDGADSGMDTADAGYGDFGGDFGGGDMDI